MSLWNKSRHNRSSFVNLNRWHGFAYFLSSKIAVALTLFVIVMSIGVSGFLIFTTHQSGMVNDQLIATLQTLKNVESPTAAQLSEITNIEMQLDESTLAGEILLSGYMTAITITTVGFDDVVREYAYDFMNEKWRRAYNIWVTVFVLIAYMAILYVNANFISYLVGTRLAENMKRRLLLRNISRLKGHYIVCGCSGAGSVVISEFLRTGIPVVGIDVNDEPPPNLRKINGFLYLKRDRSDDVLFEEAGICKARGLVSVLQDDSDNLYLTLTAHLMNSEIKIVSRAAGEENEEKLALAGADVSFTPSIAVGKKLVAGILNRETMDFMERMIDSKDQNCRIEEYTIKNNSPSIGKSLGGINIGRRIGISVFAIMKQNGSIVYNPGAGYILEEADVLLAIETPEQLQLLTKTLQRHGKRKLL
ncbi:MAG: potassium channel protein [Candidatus Aegiribacteria sp.]|nr:potassium channel protein [Candidatus Aegiribacteria sp.]